MNKRIRRKKHKGEFQEYLVELEAEFTGDTDKFLDDFVDMIESINCYCGGGMFEGKLDMCIELGKKMDTPIENKNKIELWLKNEERVEQYKFGDIVDAWYGHKIKV